MGLLDDLTTVSGKITKVQDSLKLAANDPIVASIKQAIGLLPEGGLKSWVSANPIEFWKKIGKIFSGYKYSTGERRLGERYIDQVIPTGSPNAVKSNKDVPDDMVEAAMKFFTFVLGVRITNDEDIQALYVGPEAYKARPDKQDIPMNAVRRAVYLMQNYYPFSTLNNSKWDLSYFEQYPLVAPIPGLEPGTLYNGTLPGGAVAVNGLIPIDASIKQVAQKEDATEIIKNNSIADSVSGIAGNNTIMIIVAIVVIGLLIYFVSKKQKV